MRSEVRRLSILYKHCVKSLRIRSYSDPYFPSFGLNKSLKKSLKNRDMGINKMFFKNFICCFNFMLNFNFLLYSCQYIPPSIVPQFMGKFIENRAH